MLTATSPPLKGAGGMFITESCKKLFSLISPLKEVRELAQRSMCKGGGMLITKSNSLKSDTQK